MIATKNHYIIYGDERIEFSCVPRNRVSSRIMIKVHPDCRIVVYAPAQTPVDDVHDAVKKKARWIYTQLKGFRVQLEHLTPRRYCSGESHYYLGKQYLLKIVESPGEKQQVKLLRGRIEVKTREQSEQQVKRLLYDWYKDRARVVFSRQLDAMLEQTLWVSEPPDIRLLAMKTQWGGCSPSGALTFNPHLVKAPRECIDYVILHELCHIAEHNHSKRFYRLMSRIMPNWEPVKERLDGIAGKLLNGTA